MSDYEEEASSKNASFLEHKDSRRGVLKKALSWMGLAAVASIPDMPPVAKTYTQSSLSGKSEAKDSKNTIPGPVSPQTPASLHPIYPDEERVGIEYTKPEKPVSIKERVLYPTELPYKEVIPWIGKMRNSHETILTESLFTTELGNMSSPEKREAILDAIADAHAEALIEHYRDIDAIIGLDPGHGGSDVGSGSNGLAEKDLTWTVAQKTAQKIFDLSQGKYTVVMLRPENPQDEDIDGDGNIAAVERIQKRKALLLQMEKELRKDHPDKIGKDIAYISIHFNGMEGGSERVTEVYWPNEIAMESDIYREGSRDLAQLMQSKILNGLRNAGYDPVDRGAKEDPDKREPLDNSENTVGPYNALSSPKLDRILKKI